MPRARPGDVLGGGDLDQRLQPLADDLGQPGVEARLHLLLVRAGQVLVGEDDDRRLQRVLAGLQPRDLLARATGRGRCGVSLKASALADDHAAHAHGQLFGEHVRWPHCAWPCRGCPRPARRERSGSPAGGRRSASPRARRRPRRSRRKARPSPSGPSSARWCAGRRSAASAASCSASDRLSSMARVRSCQCSGSASQSTRFDTKVQVRIWAMRLASVSISPSVRSASATCLANQSSGMRSSGPIRNL